MITKVKMVQGAAIPFAYPFAAAFGLAGGSPASITQATNEAARRFGIELSTPGAQFVLGNIGVQNAQNVPGQGGGLATTLAQEAMNVGVERIDSYLGHRAALSRGNVFAIVDELFPVLEAGATTAWKSTPQALLTDLQVYNAARTAYDPATHSIFAPNQLTYFGPRYLVKAGLYAARKLTAKSGMGKYLNLRSLLAGGK